MTTILYHSADADGLMSRAVCEKFISKDDHIVCIGWNYGDPIPTLPADGDVYMVDICIDEIVSNVLLRERLVWIDHHKTSIEKWSHLDIRGLRIDGVAACRLCWHWFNDVSATRHLSIVTDWSQQQEGEPKAVYYIGMRDVWQHRGMEVESACNCLNLGLVAATMDTYEALLMDKGEVMPGEMLDAEELLDLLLKRGFAVEEYLKVTSRQRAERGAMIRQWQGLHFLMLNSSTKGSMALDAHAKSLHEEGIHIDALLVWHVDNQGRVDVSMYHVPWRKEPDLSVIAKKFGGGGHSGACGFRTNIDSELIELCIAI